MRDRLITLLAALGALALFGAMFLPGGGSSGQGDVPRPTTAERRGNGYYAALTWLEAEHVRVVSLRERFGVLGRRSDLPATGNLLIVTLPATVAFKTEEFLPLDRWVRAGNTLVVLAALADDPDWAFRGAGLAPADLNLLTGLTFETLRARANRMAARVPQTRQGGGRPGNAGAPLVREGLRLFSEPDRSVLVPNRDHVYFRGVHAAIALSDYSHQSWALKVPYEGFALELAHERDSGAGVFWTRPLGAGRIVVSGFGTLFTNRALALADNAALFANIVGADLGRGGAVLFDDRHQGIGAAYDPEKFYRDSRLYATLGILLGLWLAWVLGSTAMRMPSVRQAAPREADLVRATGGFLARVLRNDVAARRLFDHFLKRLPPSAGSRARPEDAWRYLEQHPRIARDTVAELEGWYARACAGRRVPLERLHNALMQTLRQITA